MNLTELTVKNFRCIENLSLRIEEIENSFTYTLLGVNESGKSSFLRAVSLIDNESPVYPQDYFNDIKPIEIDMKYQLTSKDVSKFKDVLKEDFNLDIEIIKEISFSEVVIHVEFSPDLKSDKKIQEIVDFKKIIFDDFELLADGEVIKKLDPFDNVDNFSLQEFFESYFINYFWDQAHKIIFWKSDPEYLILDEIDLKSFSANPRKTSIPLYNCFCLAGIEDIKIEIDKLSTSVARQNLTSLLSESVTEHINKVWPEHKISIRFDINNNKITFLVEDIGVKYKIKTTGQRSDGFRQFISFLLTLSAENLSRTLVNSILLLDEPETHLHPTAQLNLLEELIKLSKEKNNNIVFFATHSNYMIDKNQIDRCYKVIKLKNDKTHLEKIERIKSTFSEVNFEVFGIPTTDYHNELYGYLEAEEKGKLKSLPKIKKWDNDKTKATEEVSLPTYIRHSIHHPENKLNKTFTENDLKKSIEILRELKYGK